MPDKTQIFTKYAMRLLEDLQQLHALLQQIFFFISHRKDFSELLENQHKLSERIDIQKNFLELIKQQYPLQSSPHHALEQEISNLGRSIAETIENIQPLLLQRREELQHLLDTSQPHFHGHKKALCQNHSTPRLLDITL